MNKIFSTTNFPLNNSFVSTIFLGIVITVIMVYSVQAQMHISSVVPDNADPGDSDVNVVATITGEALPPDAVQPTSYRIGTISGSNITRNGTEVNADFNFPSDYTEDVYDVSIIFPSPEGDLILTLTNGFTIGEATVTNDGLVLNTAYSFAGYTLFTPLAQTLTYLVDNNGNVVHTWESSYCPNLSVYLQDDGSIIRTAQENGMGLVEHIDKDGNVIWSWSPTDPNLNLHHDVEPLPNGNILMIAYDIKTDSEAIAAGRNPSLLSENELWLECIIEVEPIGSSGGTIVWEWHVWDHLIQDYDSGASNYGVIADHPELVDLNYVLQSDEDWLHANGIDYNKDLDQILLSLRSFGEIWIIDHSTTTSEAAGTRGGNAGQGGDLLYRWGNPQVYNAGDSNEQKLFGQHDAEWIESGLPGSGNILIFNNGQGRIGVEYSSVDEITPPLDGYRYSLSTGSVWGPTSAIWSYSDSTPTDFYADHISGAQRLLNGNTLVCNGTTGEFFEVTSNNEIVWDYINPYSVTTPQGDSTEVFRAVRFAIDAEPVISLGLNKFSPENYTYPIVDTGQTEFYDDSSEISEPAYGEDFYGQDGQYFGYQPYYTLSEDELTVLDNVTGLTWTRSPDLEHDGDIDIDDKLSFSESLAYADTVLNPANFGGYNDWRLPSMKELYSLMNFNGTDPNVEATDSEGLIPFIDTTYFDYGYGDIEAEERIIDSQFWSTNEYVDYVFVNQTGTFGLNLADGRIKCYPNNDKLNYVYFCRGNTSYGINNFFNNNDGTITDSATGLMWTQDDSGEGLKWGDALAYAQTKNDEIYLGYNDWRLPNAKELHSIVDYTRSPSTTSSAAIDPLFNCTQITNEAGDSDYAFYWSSSTHLKSTGSAGAGVYISFGRGLGTMDGATVIDVHGAGCQRSDPKDGDPNDYPSLGNGPQGDVSRVFNYVRLVRDTKNNNSTATLSSEYWEMYK